MLILLAALMSLTFYGMGIVTGRATAHRKILSYRKTVREVGNFARQQSAVGDSTGTVIADMIDNLNSKEL